MALGFHLPYLFNLIFKFSEVMMSPESSNLQYVFEFRKSLEQFLRVIVFKTVELGLLFILIMLFFLFDHIVVLIQQFKNITDIPEI